MAHRGYFTISLGLLKELLPSALPGLLDLPEGATAHLVEALGDKESRITVVVEHPDLPEVAVGGPLLEVSPVWEVDESGRIAWRLL